MMRRKIISAVLILAALVAIVPYIFAAPDSIDGTVRSIKTNEPIGGLTIDIVNCTDESQIFNTTTTGASGTFQIDYNNTWGNYSINVSGNSYSYIDRQFKNNTHCFENGTNVTLQIYPVSTSSLNVTLKDTANSRPIPDAEIKLYRSNLPGDPPIDQSDNYRCSDGTCKTGADGSILLIIPITGTYNITIESNDYDNWNETLATFNVFSDLGKNRDYTKTLRGRGLIAGDIQDFYNGKEIEGAFVELYRHDSDPFSGENLSFSGIYNYSAVTGASGQYKIYIPPSLILSNHYDIRASHIDWTPEINYNDDPNPDGGWDSLSTDIIVRMKGKLLINGSIYDCNNGDTELSLDIYVTDKTGNGFDYYIHTDNGNFSLFVKNTTTGYNGYNITINGTEYNATVLADSQQNISTCVNGLQQINGTVKDIENEQPISNVTIVINLGDGTTYYTQTLADGTFDTDVKGGTTFSIDIDKTGYTGRSALADDDGLYETIYLTGTHHIYGYIEDKEGSKRTAGPKIENASIEILNQTTSEKIYNTTTDANGYYSIYISSEINFTISLNRNLYDSAEANYSAGEHPNSTIYLTGNTHIDGHILDESAYAIDKNITAGSTLEFMDSNGTKYILTSTAGEYSIDMAISSYNITASKTGFTTKSETGAASGSSITKDISLKGDLNITIYTTDNFSSQSIDLINMRLFDESSGIVKYESISTLNGMKNVFVDSNREYHIALYENNYLPVYELVNPNGTEFVKEYRMIAKYETRITDSENGMPVENAIVYAYHYFNQTYYPQTLNGTTLTVYVNCSGAFFDNINVTITGDTHNDSKNTTAGIATFTTVPLSNYTVEANGSLEGCSTRNVSIIIDRGGITYNTTIELDTTTIMVHVTDPLSETIYPANASYQNQTGDNITMQSFNNTYYYAGYIALGSYNVMANESDHYNNAVVCNVTAIGEVNWCNITLQPRPGNLSIYIDNTESNPITGAIVNISNGTASHQTITSAGWANFTDIESFWNLTINATGIGYQNTSQTDIYTYSNDDTTYTFTLNVTLLTIDVSDDLGILENANVSLTDPATGAILKDYLGNLLTNLTGDEGNVIFEQFNLSSYNLTINETSHDFYNQTIIIQMDQDNSMQINLDTTRVTVNVFDTQSNPLENIYITLNKTDGAANFTGYTNGSGQIILENQTFPPGTYNLTVNGTDTGYNYTEKQISIYAGGQITENAVLEEFRLTVHVNSSYDNSPAFNVTVTAGTLPAETTDMDGTAEFRNLKNKTYQIKINGTEAGYNYTNTSVTVTGNINITIFLDENTFRIIVEDEDGNPVDGGVEVILWDPYDTNIYDDAAGYNLINHTTPTDNNITFRKMQYEPTPGNTVTMVANGSGQGYSINQTDYTILNGTNGPNTTILNITQLLVNVTNSTGSPINAANVTMLTQTGGTVQNALGQIMNGTTASSGTISFLRIIPDTYNISIEKNVSGVIVYNSTLITISAGEHSYVHLDPNNTIVPSLKGTYYTEIFSNETYDLTINTSGSTGSVEGITVKIYASGYNFSDSYWYNYEATDNKTTDANGVIVISDMPSGVYDVLIDGEAQGYGITKTQIQFGKLVFSKGVTGSNGNTELLIDGRELENAVDNGYFIRVDAAGYSIYDMINNGETGLKGTYFDNAQYDQHIYPGYSINNRTEISVTGIINLTGTIMDRFAQHDNFKNLTGTLVKFILHGTQTVRYTTYSDENGTYQTNVSPVSAGATDLASPVIYDITSSKTGYITGAVEETMPNNPITIISDIKLSGTGTIDGTVRTFDGSPWSPISGIIVKYIDNATLSEIYRTTTDNSGRYNMTVNPYYQPYKLSFSDPTSNTKNYTTQSYTESHTDEIYCLLRQNQAIINIYVLDDYSSEVENAEITVNSTIDGIATTEYTNYNGKLDFFIDGEEWNLGQYNITIDGTTLGYGSGYRTQNIVSGYNSITITINTTKINISASSNLGSSTSIYNTTADLTGTMSDSKDIENNTATFNKLISGNYTVTFSSPFFSGNQLNIEINDSNAGTTIQNNIILNESIISIRVINQSGGTLENISISVNGPTAYSGKTDASGWLNQTEILSGNYTINFTNTTEFTDNNYFIPANISVTQTRGNTTYIKVTAIERIINVTVHAYDLKDIYNGSRAEIADDTLNISLTNDTGITQNKTGDANSILTSNGIANFTTLHEGAYRINASGSNHTSDNETTFNTTEPGFLNTPQDIFLKQKDSGYINATILSGSTPIADATVKLYWNSTAEIASELTDAQGRTMLKINATIYNSTLYLEVTKTGYVTKQTSEFNITIGEIYNNITAISQESAPPGPSGGSSSTPSTTPMPPSSSGDDDAEDDAENDAENMTEETEIIYYKYTENRTEIETQIKDNPILYQQLEEYFGELSDSDIVIIAVNTEAEIEYLKISRDIKTETTGENIIGLNIYYTGDADIQNLVLYDILPKNLITTEDIVFTESSAFVTIDDDTDSYIVIFPTIETDTYRRIEYRTEKPINISDIYGFSKPITLATGLEKADIFQDTTEKDIIEPEPKKSVLDYWWIIALAAIAAIAGIIIARHAGRKNQKNYSFTPNETKKPLNPPTMPNADTPYGFGISHDKIAAFPKKVASTVENIEEKISEDIKTARKEVTYLTKPLEKEKFIVD